MDLADIYDAYAEDERFSRLRPGKVVPGNGNAENPHYFIVGPHPTAVDTNHGGAFLDAAGDVLRQLVQLAGIDESACWFTHLVKYRPPETRTSLGEQLASAEYLRKEWRAVGGPTFLIAIGAAAWYALDPSFSTVFDLEHRAGLPNFKQLPDGKECWIIPMLHPWLGLRGSDKDKERLERQWEQLPAVVREHGGYLL